MAKFTAAVDIDLLIPSLQIQAAAGQIARIPDAMVADFATSIAPNIPGFAWVTQDETSSIPSLPIGQTDVSGLTAALAAKYPTTGGTISGAVTVTGSLHAQSIQGVIYADQYSSIQAAIDAAPTTGATVYISAGTYAIASPLTLKSNVSLRGAGMGTQLVASSAISIVRGTSVANVTIADLYIDGGQSTTGGAADNDGIEAWTGCDQWTIRNCYITRTARDGIGLRSGAGHLVEGNTIVSPREDGITLNGVTDCRVVGNFLSSIGGDAILLKSVRRSTVQGNTIVSPGVAASGAGISIGADSATFNEYIAVIGNTVISATGASIYCAFSSYCTFSGNTLKTGSSYGLWFDSSQDCIFSGNIIDGMAGHGLRIVSTATRLTAANNIIQNVGTANNGVEAAVGSGHRFVGNQFSGTMNRGISCSSSSSIISANHFSATGGAAIRIAGADVVASDNECLAAGESGAIWATGARVSVVSNRVRGSSGHGILFAAGGDNGVVANNIVSNSASTKDGIRLDAVTSITVVGNRCYDDQGTPTQEHGLHMVTGATAVSLAGNLFTGNVTDAMLLLGTPQIGTPSGTTFPVAPATSERYYRTDRNLEYVYDGTRWLTTTLYQLPLGITDVILPLSATATPFARVIGAHTTAYDAYLVDFRYSSFIATTNTSAAFWTIALRDSAGSTLATSTTAADSANAWTAHVVSINALLGTSKPALDCTATKTSTPGNATILPSVTYRLVG